MLKLNLTQFIVCVLIFSTFSQSILAYLSKSFLQTKYIEDLCSSDKPKLNLAASGKESALRIIARNGNLTKDYTDCIVIISSALKGVILKLDTTNDFYFEENDGIVQLLPDYKNSSNQNPLKSSYESPSIKLAFSKCCKPEEKLTIIATTYISKGLGTGYCRPGREFRCDSGHCILKQYFCDGIKNCPDGSDELFSKLCMSEPTYPLKPIDFDWNFFPTSKSVVEYRKSFNVTITSAITCAFLIFIFGIIRLVCHYHCAERQTQRQHQSQRPCATFSTFSIIRQRPDFQPEYESPPPPSYVSLINDTSNTVEHPNGNPPAYSTIVPAGENCQTQINNHAKNNDVCGPPPPYEP